MLVLTRKKDETIKIGSNIVIRVNKIGTGTVKLGIEAPPSVRVMRGELAEMESSVPNVVEFSIDESADEFAFEMMLVQS